MSNKLFRIEIIQPKFDEIYRQYEEIDKKETERIWAKKAEKNPSFEWDKLSPENLEVAQKVIRVSLNFMQIQPPARYPFLLTPSLGLLQV